MRPQLSFAIYADRDEVRRELHDRVGETGEAEVVASLREPGELREAVTNQRPDVLLVDLGQQPEGLLDRLESLPTPRPVLLFVGSGEDTQLILRAMRLGAREFFPGDLPEGALKAVIHRLRIESAPTASIQRNAPVVAVMGAKGGVGATVLACQLADALQKGGARTAVMDLNLPLGDVALYLDINPQYTFGDVAAESELFDATYLQSVLQRHPSGLQILASPERAEDAEFINAHHMERALSFLRSDFDWVVCDVSRKWDDVALRALELADLIYLVTVKDVPTLSHARQCLGLLERLGIPRDKVRLVANRDSRSDAITEKDYAGFLGRAPDVHIPNDYEAISSVLNQGTTVTGRASARGLRDAFAKLVAQTHEWCGIELREEETKDTGGFRLPFWRK
jgi:pilus assembly protein CpaE